MTNLKFENGLPVKVIGNDGSEYKSLRDFCKAKHVCRKTVKRQLNESGYFMKNGVLYSTQPHTSTINQTTPPTQEPDELSEEYKKFLAYKEIKAAPFEKY